MSELNLDFLDETLDKYEAKGKKRPLKKSVLVICFMQNLCRIKNLQKM